MLIVCYCFLCIQSLYLSPSEKFTEVVYCNQIKRVILITLRVNHYHSGSVWKLVRMSFRLQYVWSSSTNSVELMQVVVTKNILTLYLLTQNASGFQMWRPASNQGECKKSVTYVSCFLSRTKLF